MNHFGDVSELPVCAVCFHHVTSHPFGHSENLFMTGKCLAKSCTCQGWQPQDPLTVALEETFRRAA